MAHSHGQASQQLLASAILWRDHTWWELTKAFGTMAGPANANSWRHHRSGRRTAWEDVFVRSVGAEWKVKAACKSWHEEATSFVHKVCTDLGVVAPEVKWKPKESSSATKKEEGGVPPSKKRRVVFKGPQWWGDRLPGLTRFEVVGDSVLRSHTVDEWRLVP
jgi:hypothetical protein